MLAAGWEFDGGGAPERRRVVILRSGGDSDDDGFRVAADVDAVDLPLPCSGEAVESGANGYGHGAGAADACAGRSFGICSEGKTALRVEKFGDFREEREAIALGFHERVERGKAFFALDVAGNQLDTIVAGGKSFDHAGGVEGNRGVHGDCAGMKEIERPDVERASGEVHAGRCFGFDDHGRELTRFEEIFSGASLTDSNSHLKQ